MGKKQLIFTVSFAAFSFTTNKVLADVHVCYFGRTVGKYISFVFANTVWFQIDSLF